MSVVLCAYRAALFPFFPLHSVTAARIISTTAIKCVTCIPFYICLIFELPIFENFAIPHEFPFLGLVMTFLATLSCHAVFVGVWSFDDKRVYFMLSVAFPKNATDLIIRSNWHINRSSWNFRFSFGLNLFPFLRVVFDRNSVISFLTIVMRIFENELISYTTITMPRSFCASTETYIEK